MTAWKPRPREWKARPWVWPILHGVPVPPQYKPLRAEAVAMGIKHTLAALEVGECFVVNGYGQKAADGRQGLAHRTSLQVANDVRRLARDFGIRITCRTVGRGVVMVWRTA